MKNRIPHLLIVLLIGIICSCNQTNAPSSDQEETWKLGWRMIENSWAEDYEIAESQFDSLYAGDQQMDYVFLSQGLEVKMELDKKSEVIEIIAKQSEKNKRELCKKQFSQSIDICKGLQEEKVDNKELQLKIIKLFVEDQAIRGNILTDLIGQYSIDTTNLKTEYDRSNPDEIDVDQINRDKLKEIFETYGFPTQKMIGEDAMQGIFFIIQHADGDTEWQKAQLPYIESAVEIGDFTKQKYAYLFDRIMVNSGLPQRYGTQFSKVDIKKEIVELKDTEDLPLLDQRRMKMGMMPIEMYKRSVLRR